MNPWTKEHFNLTEQMAITKRDSAMANSLQADALRLRQSAPPTPTKPSYSYIRRRRPVISDEMFEIDRVRAEHATNSQ